MPALPPRAAVPAATPRGGSCACATGRRARRFAGAAAALALAALASPASAQSVLDRSRAAYAALESYEDEGVVTVEQGTPGAVAVERHSFRTLYRSPRNFLLDFIKAGGGERLVIWCDGGDFQSWWSATGVHTVHSGGRGTVAFATAVYPTSGAAYQIPPLLFPAARMYGPVAGLEEAREEGVEEVNGRRTHRISGVARGHFGSARPITIWIDAESLLVVRILEDTPEGMPAGQIQRITTTLQPRANPELADERFRFVPPSQHRPAGGRP